jgi:hypothetical protein
MILIMTTKYFKAGQTLSIELVKQAIAMHEADPEAHPVDLTHHDHPVEQFGQYWVENHTHYYMEQYIKYIADAVRHKPQHIEAFRRLGINWLNTHTHKIPDYNTFDRVKEAEEALPVENATEVQLINYPMVGYTTLSVVALMTNPNINPYAPAPTGEEVFWVAE